MADESDLHIGRRLFRRRRILGMTQQQVAAKVGVRFQQIQKYECGASTIAAARVWQLAVALEVPIDYFYDGLPGVAPQPAGRAAGRSPARHAESREETRDLLDAFYGLGLKPRQGFLALTKALEPSKAA